MGRKRPQKGGPRGGGRRTPQRGDQRRAEPPPNRAGNGTDVPGSSRLLLTRVVREGAIWDVYVATTARSGARNVTLEFEGTGPEHRKLRYTRPVEGALLDALHNGAPVTRVRLLEELDLAVRGVEAGSNGEVDAPVGPDSSGPATDNTLNSG